MIKGKKKNTRLLHSNTSTFENPFEKTFLGSVDPSVRMSDLTNK